MKYVDVIVPGGPEAMRVVEGPAPQPGPGEVLIRVEAAGVNRPDLSQRAGNYPPPPGASPVLGLEVAGTIEGTSERVCALVPGGGYAEYCVVPKPQCLPVPSGLSMIEAGGSARTTSLFGRTCFRSAD